MVRCHAQLLRETMKIRASIISNWPRSAEIQLRTMFLKRRWQNATS